jgi:hypothetical protein
MGCTGISITVPPAAITPSRTRFGQFNVVAIAGAEVAAGLGNANDGFARLQLVSRQTVVEIAFEIERRHLLIVGIVEPLLGSQFWFDI